MTKKPLSQVEVIQNKIELAHAAVSKLGDEPLRAIAFQIVLQRLLVSDDMILPESEHRAEARESSVQEPKRKAKQPKGLKGRMEELIVESFFNQKRTIGEVKTELEAHGWFHRREDLTPTLLRLIKEKRLRRIKEPENDGGKLVWRYSNW